ncbi:NAD(P)H-dependent oxidoreductase [Lysobacter arvi]|uniref:NAD(P)H-dependent oxidoreductase n=1 Tax=Lysobacter arvi TaxID=3038776 RepID=A0ABU1CHD5_9GAMM|nr:NAD(P)H-dependent oxidoreductase [Lysobacter arvi]MDR0184366.1 NAD(P)H-dependent oxidoreductase [Lysobacter arvi]
MHALIVVSHPNPASFTHAIANEVARGIAAFGAANTHEFADLAAEGFDPRFSAADHALHLREASPAADVAREHARLDRADALVLVYPVFWWSFPGLLKGWIDRVFTNGWAYEEAAGGKLVKKLQGLDVHLVANAGATTRTYARHGYFGAMKTQIDHGIFGYCGARVATSELLLPDARTPAGQIEAAYAIGQKIFPSSQPMTREHPQTRVEALTQERTR